jgi:hypothetical protein
MNRTTMFTALCLLGTFLLTASGLDSSAYAQQKKKTETKQVAPQATAPVQQVTPAKPVGATMRDFLQKYKGTKTNLGMLVRVEADHFVVEEDGVTIVYPMSNIQKIKIHKPDEGEEDPISIDISLL